MANPNIFLSAPIPGQSLTVEPGSVPWENPPQHVKLEDVVNFYTNKFDDPELIMDLLEVVKRDIPILTVVNTITKAAMMQGIHTVDVGFLVTPILVEMIKTIAELNDVPYVISSSEKNKKDRVDPRVIKELIDDMKKSNTEQPIPEEEKPSAKGLMARGDK
jgi:hypothetical protein